MAILDDLCTISASQAVTADAASGNTFDSGAAADDIGEGTPLGLGIFVEVAADGTTTDETYEFQIIQSANANLSSPDILAARAIGYALLTAGSKHVVPLPPGAKTKRYLGAYYNVGGTSPSVTVSAFLAPLSVLGKWKTYDDAL